MNKFEELSEDFNLEHLDKMQIMLKEIVKDRKGSYKTLKIRIDYNYYADQLYFHVTDIANEFYYIITWYKSGEIGCILFQGEIIDKGDFENFYKFLREEYGKWILEEI